MGIRDHPTAPHAPWQNGRVERLIGSIRRESLDHLVVFGEAHLRRIFKTYAAYYNAVRTHLSLAKDAPEFRRRQKDGRIAAIPEKIYPSAALQSRSEVKTALAILIAVRIT
jgi:transposase InsO family protein